MQNFFELLGLNSNYSLTTLVGEIKPYGVNVYHTETPFDDFIDDDSIFVYYSKVVFRLTNEFNLSEVTEYFIEVKKDNFNFYTYSNNGVNYIAFYCKSAITESPDQRYNINTNILEFMIPKVYAEKFQGLILDKIDVIFEHTPEYTFDDYGNPQYNNSPMDNDISLELETLYYLGHTNTRILKEQKLFNCFEGIPYEQQ